MSFIGESFKPWARGQKETVGNEAASELRLCIEN